MVEFMEYVNYFLGTEFNWLQRDIGNISEHLCQSSFTKFTAHLFSVHTFNKVLNMTPYHSGFPIYSIPPVYPLDIDLFCWKRVYQIIVGCINWIATFTCLCIDAALTFLDSYSNSPHQQHYKAAIHALKYLTSTNDYGISFHSKSYSTIQDFIHFPHH